MGNHASQDRRDRSKGGDLGQYGSGRSGAGGGGGEDKPFTLHAHTTPGTPTASIQSAAKPLPAPPQQQQQQQQQQQVEEEVPAVLKEVKDKENEDPSPERLRGVVSEANQKLLPVVIKWRGGGTKVAIAGTFNHWQTIPMVKSEKDFVAIVDLPEGSHQYKFLVDGEWKINKTDTTTATATTATTTATATTNNNTSINNNNKAPQNNNNVVMVSEADFNEFETALMPDPNDKSGDKDHSHGSGSAGEKEKGEVEERPEEDVFGQDIPEYQQSEKIRGPPVLPPHLLQVILNKDTPISCEPTLLPQPNHVMLNHMYALSIRDGMMVLSTSNRYRKKCVTTLIYRPIE